MLEVVDYLERAVGMQAPGNGAVDGAAVLKGVDLVLRLLKQKLERYEVRPFDAAGQPFDPRVHEAISRVEHPEIPRGRSRLSCRRAIAWASACCGRRWSRCRRAESPRRRHRRARRPAGRLLRNAGCRPRLDRRRDQGCVPQAGAEVAPGSQPGRQGGRGALQGAGDRLFGAVRRREAAPLRSLRRGRRTCPFAATDVTGAAEFFDALFGDLFGLQRRRSASGRDLRYTLELDFEEAALGCEKVVVFERPEDCAVCSGTGAEGGSAGLVTCARCGGEGVIRKKAGFLTSRRDCMGCGGTGQVPRVRCATCEGAGLVDRERRYTVRIPPGSTGGSTQRVPREGGAGTARRAAG